MPCPAARRISPVSILFTLLYCCAQVYAASAVLGIDLGTEYHKAVLVKPGIPLDIVLTKDSKRKEAAALVFKPVSIPSDSSNKIFPERLYGGDALALAARFPGDVYANLKPLVGLQASDPAASDYSKRYPGLQVATCKSGSVCLKSSTFASKEEPFSVEELLAMQLQNIKANAETMAGGKVRDVVLTVPAFFTAEEKKAIQVAADLAGLKVLSLTTDGLAVGLNYATSRTFPTVNEGGKPEYHLIYDMGAGSTTATVLKFQGRVVKDVGKFNKTIQEVLVSGSGWDRTLGGDALNTLILEDMIAQFVDTKQAKALKVTAADVKSHGRTMAKMWKEAERLRQILSANSETQASFESLYEEDLNFKYKISRATLEEMAKGFELRVKEPILQALKMAKLEISDLDSIILHGGAVRTPFVQKVLENVVGTADRLRTNVNSDEAAAFGAAFRGATLSPSFRVREIWTNETATYPVTMTWTAGGKEETQKMFIPTSFAGFEKQFSVKSPEEVSFAFSQEVSDSTDNKRSIELNRLSTANLTASFEELKEKYGCTADNVTATFDIRLSAIDVLPEIARAYVSCEALDTKKGVVDGVKGLFGFGSKKEGQEVLSEDEATPEADPASSSSSSVISSDSSSTTTSSSQAAEKSKTPEKPKAPVKRRFVVNVGLKTQPTASKHASGFDLSVTKSRMKAFDASDKERKGREEALNSLEGYTYRIRDLLEDDSFIASSVDKVIAEIKSKSAATSEWLYGDGAAATTTEFKAKLKELKDLIDPISARKEENAKRPESVASLQKALDQTRNIITTLKEQSKAAVAAAAEAAKSLAEKPQSTASVDELDELDDVPVDKPAETEETPSFAATVSEEDLGKIQTSFEDVEKWLAEKLDAQGKLKGSDEPALKLRDLEMKATELQMILIEALSKQMGGGFPPTSKKAKATKSSKSKTKTKTTSSKKAKQTPDPDVKQEL